MDPVGIVAWLVIAALVAAAVIVAVGRTVPPDVRNRLLVYTVPAAFLGTFMGSESFSWLSAKGPEIDGYYPLTSIIFGLVIAALAAAAAKAPPPEEVA